MTRFARVLSLFFACFAAAWPAKAADFGDWALSLPITFSGYTRAQPLTNFPVLVKLDESIPGFSYAAFGSPADGADLRFAADNKLDELDYEIESWNTNGASAVWVRLPVLAGTNTRVWAFWGNPEAGPAPCVSNGATWSPEFRGVWHMQQANVKDATTNANNGTGKNGASVTNTGVAGSSLFLNAVATSSNYVDFGTGLKMGTGSATLSIWFRTATNAVQAGVIGKSVYASAERYSINCAKAPNVIGTVFQSTNAPPLTAVTNTPWVAGHYDNQWHQLTATFNRSGSLSLYVDGALKSATNIAPAVAGNLGNTNRFFIGAYGNATGTGPQPGFYFPGSLDEGCLMSVPVSSNWVWAAWLNAASNADFNAYGAAESQKITVQSAPATGIGPTTATLNGLVAQNGDIPETDAVFCLDDSDKGTGSTGSWARVIGVGSSFTNGQALTLPLDTLVSGSTYVYRCYATNASGESWSAPQSFQTLYLPVVSNAGPVNGYVTTWLRGVIEDTGLDTPTVWIHWWRVGGAETSSVPMGLQGGSFSNAVKDLTPFETYRYRILASNIVGAVWSAEADFQTLATVVETITYTGVNTGLWETASNWTPSHVPTPDNDVIIPARKTVLLSTQAMIGSLLLQTNAVLSIAGTNSTLHWRGPQDAARTDWVGLSVTGSVTLAGGNLAIGGLNQAGPSFLTVSGDLLLQNCPANASNTLVVYAGPTNASFGYSDGGARVTVGRTTTLGTNSWIYPYCHQVSGAPVVFDLQDLTVSATAAGFNASGRGYALVGASYYGPGTPVSGSNFGGSHGGLGGGASAAYLYGFIFAPYRPGSSGRVSTTSLGLGGGAIRILARTLSLAGKLLADGVNHSGYNNGAGSGGSIWITCSNFIAAPTASLSAKGGDATQHTSCGSGGGGRITVMTDMPTPSQLASLYATGTCEGLLVVTTNMADPVLSPYPALATVAGGLNTENWMTPSLPAQGKPGTTVWLRNKGDDFQVTVWGSPVPMTTEPAYGVHRYPAGEHLFSAVSPSPAPSSSGLSRLSCSGYTWSNATQQGSGSATSVLLSVTADTWLTWSWTNLEHRLTVRSGGKGAVVQDFADWHTNGSLVTLTVQPETDCSFLYWVGDVPYADRTNAALTLTMSQPRTVIACFTAPPAGARSLVWAGGASTNDWFNPACWDGSALPGLYDSVTLTNGTNVIAYPAHITVAALTLGRNASLFVGGTGSGATALAPVSAADTRPYSLTVTGNLTATNGAQLGLGGLNASGRVDLAVGGNLLLSNSVNLAIYAGYTGPTTDVATYQSGGAGVTVGGVTYLGTNSWIHPFCHQVSGAPAIFTLQNLTITANAGFNADYRGFGRLVTKTAAGDWGFAFYGPGKTTVNYQQYGGMGGSYGGKGGKNGAASLYGFANAPFWPGSPGGDYRYDNYTQFAGGAIRILAKQVQLNGQLNARGIAGRTYSAGSSGGGIWVTCTRFDAGPLGRMNASGGLAYDYNGTCGGGGGGRIALALNLSPNQISDLYATGTAKGLVIQDLTNTVYAPTISVAAGLGYGTDGTGTVGTAVFIMSAADRGTLIMIR